MLTFSALKPVEFKRSGTYSEGPVFDYEGYLSTVKAGI